MATGTVKWFDSKKGFGFILMADGREVFVHHSSIAGTGYKFLSKGAAVEFDLYEADKGLEAKNVVIK